MTEQKRLGTLIVVAMEARNLSTRDIVGKGDPFVAFHLDGDSKRIRAEKRGGQHPKWDEEVRFSVMNNTSKKMKIQVFNDDKRDPVLIGDTTIDLSEVLEKTEWDAWHEINFRNKYAGEVSLEMTFYYDEPPPQKIAHHNQPAHSNSLPPQTPTPNSYPNSASHIAPPPVVNKPISAPSAYPPSNVYPPTSTAPNVYPPLNSSNVYPPPSSTAPSNVYHPNSAPSNVYPPHNSAPSNVYPPHNSPPQSQPPQFFGPNRTQSPVSSQYPPATSQANVYPPPPQSQGFPPVYPPISSPPVSTPSFRPINAPTRHDSGNLAFPIPIPTPITGNSSYPQSGGYPPSNYPPNNNPYPPPNNIYPPPGNIYPPPQNTFNQGYPPNPYPPSGHY